MEPHFQNQITLRWEKMSISVHSDLLDNGGGEGGEKWKSISPTLYLDSFSQLINCRENLQDMGPNEAFLLSDFTWCLLGISRFVSVSSLSNSNHRNDMEMLVDPTSLDKQTSK